MLVGKTKVERKAVTQEVRVIVPPLNQTVDTERGPGSSAPYFVAHESHYDAPMGALRKVQLLVPDSPSFFFSLDVEPEAVGLNRGEYKMSPLVSNATVDLWLQPDQWIVASVSEGFGTLGVVTHFFDPRKEGF